MFDMAKIAVHISWLSFDVHFDMTLKNNVDEKNIFFKKTWTKSSKITKPTQMGLGDISAQMKYEHWAFISPILPNSATDERIKLTIVCDIRIRSSPRFKILLNRSNQSNWFKRKNEVESLLAIHFKVNIKKKTFIQPKNNRCFPLQENKFGIEKSYKLINSIEIFDCYSNGVRRQFLLFFF